MREHDLNEVGIRKRVNDCEVHVSRVPGRVAKVQLSEIWVYLVDLFDISSWWPWLIKGCYSIRINGKNLNVINECSVTHKRTLGLHTNRRFYL